MVSFVLTSNGDAYVFFLLALSSDDSVHAVQQKIAKTLYFVLLPVVDPPYEIGESIVQ